MKESLEMLSSVDEVNVEKTNLHVGYQWDISFTKMIGNLPSLVAFKSIFEVDFFLFCMILILQLL